MLGCRLHVTYVKVLVIGCEVPGYMVSGWHGLGGRC